MSRNYSSVAGQMVLMATISSTDTTITVDTTAGLPVAYPYTLLLDYGTASEEIVDVTGAAGTTLTVTRGRDGTISQAHSLGAKVRHGMTARDLRESRAHEDATGAHGVAAVAGLTETQTFDNKTFQPTGDHVAARFRSRASNTTPFLQVETEGGSPTAQWWEGILSFFNGSTLLMRMRQGASAVSAKQILEVNVVSDIHGVTGTVQSGATGRFLRLLTGATELFSVAADGVVRAAGAVFAGAVQITGNLVASGSITGASLSTTGAASVGSLSVTGATTGPLANTVTSLGTRMTTAEGNITSQGNRITTLEGARWDTGVVTLTGNSVDKRQAPVVFSPPFPGVPLVFLQETTDHASSGITSNVWPFAVTANGFSCYAVRNTTADVTVRWFAVYGV